MVRGADEHPIAQKRSTLRGPFAKTYPASMAADAIIQGIEERRRIVVTRRPADDVAQGRASAVVRGGGSVIPEVEELTRQEMAGGVRAVGAERGRRPCVRRGGPQPLAPAPRRCSRRPPSPAPQRPRTTRRSLPARATCRPTRLRPPRPSALVLRHHPRRADRPARHRRGSRPARRGPGPDPERAGPAEARERSVLRCACTASGPTARGVRRFLA